jgi:hypothetical protein
MKAATQSLPDEVPENAAAHCTLLAGNSRLRIAMQPSEPNLATTTRWRKYRRGDGEQVLPIVSWLDPDVHQGSEPLLVGAVAYDPYAGEK